MINLKFSSAFPGNAGSSQLVLYKYSDYYYYYYITQLDILEKFRKDAKYRKLGDWCTCNEFATNIDYKLRNNRLLI